MLAYPLAGMIMLALGLVLMGQKGRMRTGQSQSASEQGQCPVPRNTTPTVATSTLRSVARDNLRS